MDPGQFSGVTPEFAEGVKLKKSISQELQLAQISMTTQIVDERHFRRVQDDHKSLICSKSNLSVGNRRAPRFFIGQERFSEARAQFSFNHK